MNDKSKNKFTFKIIFSYLVLAILALASGYFIYTEINTYLSSETAEENDAKLLKTGSFLTHLYEAESLSKLALQSKTKRNFNAYSQKIDSIFIEIESLKQLTNSVNQKGLLDSVHILLEQKVANSNELLNLKVKNDANSSIDKALKEFSKMEASLGKITAEGLAPNINELSPKAQKVIRDVAAYLNANVPENNDKIANSKQVDSIINASKLLLAKAKRTDSKTQRFLAQKEMQLNQNDLELSQQLRTIISAFEQEVLASTFNDNLKKKSALKRSIRLAGFAALLGLIVVGLFAFLINRDFWRIQTYRQKLEKEKKYSESLLKSREQLISTVSHDLRSPLSTITGYTELMEGTELTHKQERYLGNVKSASDYVGNLVNDLLDFSKLEGGKLNIESVPFIAANLIQETAESLQATYNSKKLKLFLEIDPKLQKTVLGDPFRIRQILTNLVGNAFKFTEEGHITIKAKASSSRGKSLLAKIEVSDTGIGIAKEKQHLIFNEFTQADSATEKKFGGYGLGLTISKKLTELLKGTLTLESKLSKGSTFTLQLPLQITNKSVEQNTEVSYLVPKLRLLIIDDDTALLGMLQELTESMGMTAHTFTNFLQIEKDSHLGYDLVLTDIQMPQITGFEVLERLRSGEFKHYKKQPIIAMTGRRDLESEAYTSIGFDQVLQKPFSKRELIGMLKLLGFQAKEVEEVLPTASTATDASKEKVYEHYDLGIIHSFLGTNEDAIHEVLQTFLRDTRTNMKLLEDGISTLDYNQVNQVAHRMLPMFRQLKISIVPTLERLELAKSKTMNKGQLADALHLVKKKTSVLTLEIESKWSTSPNYSD
ncbi:response regulator [Maribacter algarum]|uniref:histidine kinase n=1 Tax=Maribacter algarum (ex Zhang et al. 2020) TaxID=2578118 RepID=A0A5S3PWV7_9FLAO|nr:ATP-binding protein [Maribacter algarum]TMM59340.1 response regulator [Maribacter algarum]